MSKEIISDNLLRLSKSGSNLSKFSITSSILGIYILISSIITKAKSGTVIILDNEKGEILAMANYPSYNPNHPQRDGKNGRLSNIIRR